MHKALHANHVKGNAARRFQSGQPSRRVARMESGERFRRIFSKRDSTIAGFRSTIRLDTMENSQKNAEWFNETARKRRTWKESVEHVAVDLHQRALQFGSRSGSVPRVVDLGAGETGMSTFPYLAAGCEVYAVDSAGEALQRLMEEAANLSGKLIPRNEDIEAFIANAIHAGETYDIVVARSFLHHIPDYLKMLRDLEKIIAPKGVFISYEDPPPYDRMNRFHLFYSKLSYFSMRLFQGNYGRGLKTRWRRMRGVLREELPEDVVEYHVVRNGVDDAAIRQQFRDSGWQCEVVKYFSSDNLLTKHVGRKLQIENSFALLAHRP
jgi:SAM-dependent methyltransferase